MPKSVISKLETGTRKIVSLPELLVLAAALDVPPAVLIAPFWQGCEVPVLPDRSVSAHEAFDWLVGDGPTPIPTGDLTEREKLTRHAAETWWIDVSGPRDKHNRLVGELLNLSTTITTLRLLRSDHTRLMERIADAGADAEAITELVSHVSSALHATTCRDLSAAEIKPLADRAVEDLTRRSDELSREIDNLAAKAEDMWERILDVRHLIRAAGHVPPSLPDYLSRIEGDPGTKIAWGLGVDAFPRSIRQERGASDAS
jgi:hypothetical protein